jgi:peptide/nickel transport system permease protein
MLRHALRRLLWTLPTLIGISLITFFLLSFVPDPTDDPTFAATLSSDALAHRRRERFLDLPRFVNLAPVDVRVRAARAARAVADGDEDADEGRRELERLGGAALPYVLPRFDALPPEQRTRLALSLAPTALRMGLAHRDEATDPVHAVAFWSRLWDDRGVEFRQASVRSAVNRLVRYGATTRVADLAELDTFALDDVLAALRVPTNRAEIDRARALVDVAAHVTGRDDRIAPTDDREAARACVERWQAYWAVYRSDFVAFTGPSRVAAVLLETRYGKWALGAVTQRFGRRVSGGAVLDELVLRAPTTLAIVFAAIALAYAAAIPLGAISAARRGHRLELGIACVVLGFCAVPTAVVAVILRRVFGPDAAGILPAAVTLALALMAAPTGQQRSALAAALTADYITAAQARGATVTRVVLVHGLRNTLLPVLTLAALEGPMALGGAFVAERVFDLHGLGEATIAAVRDRDTGWLMALSISAAGLAAVFVLLSDLGGATLDPRLGAGSIARKGSA